VPHSVKNRQFRLFDLEFLHAILAEMAQPEAMGREDRLGGKSLRHRHERDLVRLARRALGRPLDAFPHALEILAQRDVFRRHARDSSTRIDRARNRAMNRWPLAAPRATLKLTSMLVRGKLIVIEGIDGSGKRTQLDLLARAFDDRGVAFAPVSFPRYDGFFGKLVARFLNGEFGSLAAVDPHFSALLYAGDRLESKPSIEGALQSGKNVLADRYIASNLAHQGARVPAEKREEFIAWLKQLEYEIYGLPAEDLVIYLRVPASEAHRLAGERGERGTRGYTKLRRDLQEADIAHLEAASSVYDALARQPHWAKIECFDAASGSLRPPGAIHAEILAAVDARVAPALGARI